MLHKIPIDIELFNEFIHKTDDRQLFIRQENKYFQDEKGRLDFTKIVSQNPIGPSWKEWGWTKETSLQWSLFRKNHDELYPDYLKAENEEKIHLQTLLNKNISACIAYDKEKSIIWNLFISGKINYDDNTAFGLYEDQLQYETPMRTITIRYEKQIPLSDFEKKFIKKYVAFHQQEAFASKRLCEEIKELEGKIPGIWAKIFVTKEKADKASNTIVLPPTQMEGEWSPLVSMYVPTPEEQQKNVDDFNAYIKQVSKEIEKIGKSANVLCELVYNENEEHDSLNKLYNEVSDMMNEISHNWAKYSIHLCYLDDDFQEFLGLWDKERKLARNAWGEFIEKQCALVEVYNSLIDILRERFDGTDREEETPAAPVWEIDDLRAETIQRYQSGIGSTFFDIDDWHIIMDNFQYNYDEKSKAIALEKAFTQHPENPTLLLRKAQEEMGKHNYKSALEWVNKAETKGPPHHPNFYSIKAGILVQMHAPEQAIPLYNKLINAQGMGLEWYHENSRYRLLDIYEKQNNFTECIRLSKELLEMNPDDAKIISILCDYYRQVGMLKEAEELANNHLEKFPDCALCMGQLGHLNVEKKEYYKAIKFFEQAYSIDKEENYDYLFQVGKAYMELKRYKEAVACFEGCVFHYHFGIEYHQEAMECYKKLNMPYAVEYHINKIIELQPESTNASQKLQQSDN